MAPLGLEEGQGGGVFAGLALGLGSVAGPQADGLNAQEVVVVAGRRTGILFGQRRRTHQQPQSQEREKLLHWEPRRLSRGLYGLKGRD